MDEVDEVREFSPEELPDAAKFIAGLPANTRVYVDEWDDGDWEFAFFDDQRFAVGSLSLLRPGRRFRVRASHPGDASGGAKARWLIPSRRNGSKPGAILVPPRTHRPRRRRGLLTLLDRLLR